MSSRGGERQLCASRPARQRDKTVNEGRTRQNSQRHNGGYQRVVSQPVFGNIYPDTNLISMNSVAFPTEGHVKVV